MKEFSQEMLEKLQKANDAVRGTKEYYKFYMETECRTNGRWHFIGHGIPNGIGTIKTLKGKTYIMCEFFGDMERFAMTEAVKELFGI